MSLVTEYGRQMRADIVIPHLITIIAHARHL